MSTPEDKFFETLATLKDNGWEITKWGTIRCADGLCPVLAVFREFDPRDFLELTKGKRLSSANFCFSRAGRKMNLSHPFSIAEGSDRDSDYYDPRSLKMRERIIDVLELRP